MSGAVEVCINLICVDFTIFHIVVLYLEFVYFILVYEKEKE